MVDKICLVTAFIDIGRTEWNNRFVRSTEKYISNFSHYLNITEDLILFIDSKHYTRLKEMCEKSNKKNITIIEITDEFLQKNIKAWSFLPIETFVMNSNFYRRIVQGKDFPENNIPVYNIVQHCKLEFLKYVIDNKLTSNEIICWTDFGYINNNRFINGEFDVTKFDRKRMNVCIINVYPIQYNILESLLYPLEIIAGTFYGGTKENILLFRDLYHKILFQEFYANDIVDDDQHVMLRCYIYNPNLFRMHHTGWENIHKYFLKGLPPS